MELFMLKRVPDGVTHWDCIYGLIVRAKTEKQARELAANYRGFDCNESGDLWLDKKLTTCTQIHEAGPPEILLVDMLEA